MMGIIVNIMKYGEKDLDFEYKNEKKLKKIKLPFLTKFYKKDTNKQHFSKIINDNFKNLRKMRFLSIFGDLTSKK